MQWKGNYKNKTKKIKKQATHTHTHTKQIQKQNPQSWEGLSNSACQCFRNYRYVPTTSKKIDWKINNSLGIHKKGEDIEYTTIPKIGERWGEYKKSWLPRDETHEQKSTPRANFGVGKLSYCWKVSVKHFKS